MIPSNLQEARQRGYTYYTVSENEIDMVPQGRLWITIGNASVYLGWHDEGLSVEIYPREYESEDAEFETWVLFQELEVEDDD